MHVTIMEVFVIVYYVSRRARNKACKRVLVVFKIIVPKLFALHITRFDVRPSTKFVA